MQPTCYLIEVAYQVFNNQDIEGKKVDDKKAQQQAYLPAIAFQGQPLARECGLTAHKDSQLWWMTPSPLQGIANQGN